jgi:tetratricopeptide (TPR) repeat protein
MTIGPLMGLFLSTSLQNNVLYQHDLLSVKFLLFQQTILSEQSEEIELEEQLIEGMDQGMKGNYPAAIKIFSRLIQAHPNYADAYYNRGIAKVKLGDKKGAIADDNQAIQINPDLAEAYQERGNLLLDLNSKTEAIKDFQKAAQLYKKQGNVISYNQIIKTIQFLEKF